MKTQLCQLTEENIETLLSYYNIIKTKYEKYNSFLTKFNKITNSYCIDIKNIFNENELFLEYNSNEFIKESIQRNLSKFLFDKMNIDIVLSNNKTIKKTINIHPIENNVIKINKLFKNYLNCLELFIRSLENHIISLNSNLEKTQLKINDITNNYITEKKIFFQKYSEFQALNKKLNIKYNEQEKNIIEYAFKMANDKKTELDENNLNLKIFETKKLEKEIQKQFINLGEFGKNFNDSYNKNIKEIKELISGFYNSFETQITHILILYQKSFLCPIKELTSDKEISQSKEKEFNEILNNNIKIIDPKFSKINFEEYQIKIINKNILEEIDIDENTKSLVNLIKNCQDKIKGKEILFIVKKMYNFCYVNKKNYIIDVQKEIINMDEKIDKLFFFAKSKRKKSGNIVNNINDKNSSVNSNSRNENKDLISEENIVKNEPTDSDIEYICKLINSKREYIDHFLLRLNNFRTLGSLSMPEKIFNFIVQVLREIGKHLIKEKQTDSGKEMIIDYETTKYIFILSQTFYYMNNGKKVYIQHSLSNVEILHNTEFWIKILENNIKEEIARTSRISGKKSNEKEICIMQIMPYISGLGGFSLDKEKINEISNFFINKYQLNDEEKKIILNSF